MRILIKKFIFHFLLIVVLKKDAEFTDTFLKVSNFKNKIYLTLNNLVSTKSSHLLKGAI